MEFLYRIAESDWFDAYMDFMAAYGLYIAAVGLGFLLCMVWWWFKHPEDFYDYEEDESEEVWFEEIDHNDATLKGEQE